jgi:flavodoxin/ferredoxin
MMEWVIWLWEKKRGENTLRQIYLFYYSGTGNTRMVTRQIVKNLVAEGFEVCLINIEKSEMVQPRELAGKLLGFGFPIYGHDYPYQVLDPFIDRIGVMDNAVPAFVYSTSWKTPGMGVNHFMVELKKRKIQTIIKQKFLCPSSGWYCLTAPESGKYQVMHFESYLFTHIASFVQQIKNAMARYEVKTFSKRGWINPIEKIMVGISKKVEAKYWNHYNISEKCINCRCCLNNCPMGNFEIVNQQVRFKNTMQCLWCMRCISSCPQNAITLGVATVGKGRYTPEFQRALMEKQIKDLPVGFFNDPKNPEGIKL